MTDVEALDPAQNRAEEVVDAPRSTHPGLALVH